MFFSMKKNQSRCFIISFVDTFFVKITYIIDLQRHKLHQCNHMPPLNKPQMKFKKASFCPWWKRSHGGHRGQTPKISLFLVIIRYWLLCAKDRILLRKIRKILLLMKFERFYDIYDLFKRIISLSNEKNTVKVVLQNFVINRVVLIQNGLQQWSTI